MTTLHQIIESKVEEFEKQFDSPAMKEVCFRSENGFGEKFEMTRGDFVKKFLRQALRDVALATVEAVKVEERLIDIEDPYSGEYYNEAIADQATKAEEFINSKK